MLWNILSFGILVLLRQLLFKFAALCGQTGDNSSHYRNRCACCTHACDVGTGCKYWTGGVMYSMYWFGVLYWTGVFNWTGVLSWTGVLYVLDWCVVCTGLVCYTGQVCCMYLTGVLYVLDRCVGLVHKNF